MLIDLHYGERLTRTDAFLLLLEAQNHVLFREREWHWSDNFERSAKIVARTARTLQDAMYRLRQDRRDVNLSPGVARAWAAGGAGRLR